MKHTSIVLTMVILLAGICEATVWYVHPDSAMNCIQHCLDSCSTADTVLVGPGIYYENIVWPATQGIDLVSEQGADNTILDGDSTGRVITISSGINSSTLVEGFTVRNGFAGFGGGIFCSSSSSPTISNNRIIENMGTNGGGGIMCVDYSNAIIVNNEITGNSTNNSGGGIRSYNNPTIIGNIITGNSANGSGGGIRCDGTQPIIRDNVISYNTSNQTGGGIGFIHSFCTPTIVNNVVTHNSASTNGGGIVCLDGAFPTIDSCTISNNEMGGVYLTGAANIIVRNSNIAGNTNYGVSSENAALAVDCDSNWWGDASGPYHPTLNPSGLGDTVSDYVDFDPWLTSPGISEYTYSTPVEMKLQISPNPFAKLTMIRYSIENPTIGIYDVSGRLVRSFNQVSSIQNQESVLVWDGTDQANRQLPSGVYFVRLSCGDRTESQKILLVK
jgi:parallel beta-helix repeat protein